MNKIIITEKNKSAKADFGVYSNKNTFEVHYFLSFWAKDSFGNLNTWKEKWKVISNSQISFEIPSF